MIPFALFVLGAHVGSFLNVCIWRLPRNESVAEPPSHCPKCNTRLKPLDLVPLLSQILLRAKCRYCGAKISWRYAGMELLTGIVFVLVGCQTGNIDGGLMTGLWAGDAARLLQQLLVVSCLIVIFFIDLETMTIPISAALLMGLAGVGAEIWHVAHSEGTLSEGAVFGMPLLPSPLPGSILAMVAAAAFMFIVREVACFAYRREALGFGDVFMVAGIAANIGWSEQILAFYFLSVFIALALGVVLCVPRLVQAYRWARARDVRRVESGRSKVTAPLLRRTFRKLEMPFGPGIALGALVTMLYGGGLMTGYMNLAYPPQPAGQTSFTAPGLPPAPP